MLSFLKKRRERKAHEAQEAAKTAAAHQGGQDAGAAMYQALNTALENRGVTVYTNLLGVLRGRLQEITGPENGVSVKDLCRIEASIFVDQVKDYPAKLSSEIENDLRAWFAIADDAGVGALLRQHMQQRLTDAAAALALDGTALAGERIMQLEGKTE